MREINEALARQKTALMSVQDVQKLYAEAMAMGKRRYKAMEQVKSSAAGGSIEVALRKWREDIAKLDMEIEEYIMPSALIEAISQTESEDVIGLAIQTLRGYVPAYLEQYKDKIIAIIKQARTTQ